MRSRKAAAAAAAKKLIDGLKKSAEGLYCPVCGKTPDFFSGDWRFAGYTWQHHHGYTIGHIDAIRPCEEAKHQALAIREEGKEKPVAFVCRLCGQECTENGAKL